MFQSKLKYYRKPNLHHHENWFVLVWLYEDGVILISELSLLIELGAKRHTETPWTRHQSITGQTQTTTFNHRMMLIRLYVF